MKLKVLGSVSPYQNKNNNCPGFLVEKEDKRYLLDCGSGITRELNIPNDLKYRMNLLSDNELSKLEEKLQQQTKQEDGYISFKNKDGSIIKIKFIDYLNSIGGKNESVKWI